MAIPKRTTRMHPVLCLRVIQPKLNVVFACSFGQRLEKIFAIRRRVHNIPITDCSIEKSETIMVLGGDDDVLHTSILSHEHPSFRIVIYWVELLRVLLIFRYRDLSIMHDPFANILYLLAFVSPSWNGVDTPVDKKSKSSFTPPGHACVTLFCSLVVVGSFVGHK